MELRFSLRPAPDVFFRRPGIREDRVRGFQRDFVWRLYDFPKRGGLPRVVAHSRDDDLMDAHRGRPAAVNAVITPSP